jgi:Fe-S-cluster containining protein
MDMWRCVKSCGACCQLDPSDRPELEQYLTADELALYLSLVGSDGWCIHFNQSTRTCQIYPDRPSFCRVEAEVFQRMYGIQPEALNDFAIACCREQIAGIYGTRSMEMKRFNQAVTAST